MEADKLLELQFAKVQKKSCVAGLRDYLFMWWDGLPFFTFDDTKLGRLDPKVRPRFTDKFKNKKWLVHTSLGVFVAAYIILIYA